MLKMFGKLFVTALLVFPLCTTVCVFRPTLRSVATASAAISFVTGMGVGGMSAAYWCSNKRDNTKEYQQSIKLLRETHDTVYRQAVPILEAFSIDAQRMYENAQKLPAILEQLDRDRTSKEATATSPSV